VSTYRSTLGIVFPYAITIPAGAVQAVTAELADPLPSSFAVTADAKAGHVNLWLSETSYRRIHFRLGELISAGTVPDDR
jgi:hypothetical protein